MAIDEINDLKTKLSVFSDGDVYEPIDYIQNELEDNKIRLKYIEEEIRVLDKK